MVEESSSRDFRALSPLWTSRRVLIGPIVRPWDGDTWSRALGAEIPDASAHTFADPQESQTGHCDLLISPESDSAATDNFAAFVNRNYTHVVLSSTDPFLTAVSGPSVAVFAQPGDENVQSFSGPVFVSDVTQLLTLPDATWCPRIVPLGPVKPLPSTSSTKFAVLVASESDALTAPDDLLTTLTQLAKSGAITLHQATWAGRESLVEAIAESDVVLELTNSGDYGVVATEALAAGRVVLGHVSELARSQISRMSDTALPILETPLGQLASTLQRLADDPAECAAVGAAGAAYATRVHSGAMSMAMLAKFLPLEDPTAIDQGSHPTKSVESSDVSRGRIVMLVDNDVVRDSRVQKQARSAAERGWDVILLGITRKKSTNQRLRWRIGHARVRLLYKSTALKPPRRRRTPAPLTALIAYRNKSAETYAQFRVDAKRRSLEHDRAVREQAAQRAGSALLVARRAGFLLRRKAVAIRTNASLRLVLVNEHDSPTTRAVTKMWQRALGDRSWSELDPSLAEWDLVFGDTIDQLRPDIIHANDFRMLGVGARAKVRAQQQGRRVSLVWDAHEYLPGLTETPTRQDLALFAFEREHIPFADQVITVSETLADMLVRDHQLSSRPSVVENSPVVKPPSDARWAGGNIDEERGLRQDCGLDSDVPLLVYCGVAVPERGLETIVRGLANLPGIHAAFVVSSIELPYVVELQDLAHQLGVADRLHVVTYVPVDHIVPYLSGADVGVVAAHHVPNNEISLPTKFREYSHARLALVVSDVKTVSEIVRTYGLGEVFVAGDVESFSQAVATVLADKETYRWRLNHPGLLSGWSWDAAAEVLESVYASLEPPKR